MALVSKPYTFSSGATIIAAEHNANFDTLYNDYNGNITNPNVSNSAAIEEHKLDLSTVAQDIIFSGNIDFTGTVDFTAATVDLTSATVVDIEADYIILPEQSSAPTTAANQGAVYTKEAGGQTELFFREESDGTEVQLTNAGLVNSVASNVIYSWSGYDSISGSGTSGIYVGTDQTPIFSGATENIFYKLSISNSTAYIPIIVWKWTKVVGIDTLTVNTRAWCEPSALTDVYIRLNVDNGTATGESATILAVASPTWITPWTCDVSGLSNGTTYDIKLETHSTDNSGSAGVYVSALMVEGS